MSSILIDIYDKIQDKKFESGSKLEIKEEQFFEKRYRPGTTTFSFDGCSFDDFEIINKEIIEFKKITILFTRCYVNRIMIQNIESNNIDIIFSNSIVSGSIGKMYDSLNFNLDSVLIYNCILRDILFLHYINKVTVTFNVKVFPLTWRKLLKEVKLSFDDLVKNEVQMYLIDQVRDLNFNVDNNQIFDLLSYDPISSRLRDRKYKYNLKREEVDKIKIILDVRYNSNHNHISTKITNAILHKLNISGYANGEIKVENSNIDTVFINDFSSDKPTDFFNIKPFRKDSIGSPNLFEIKNSNLDKVYFDNVFFNSYSLISFYRNKYGNTLMTSCEFPNNYDEFEKFTSLENILEKDKIDDNFYKIRYETLTQLTKVIEKSGNIYETQKFQSVSNEALKRIGNLEKWDKFILRVNYYSNNHGLSILRPFGGFFIVSVVLFLVYLFSINRLNFNSSLDLSLVKYYFRFIDITHPINYFEESLNDSFLVIFIDVLRKLFLGFLIYQFVAAFRKYGKK